MSPVKVPHQPDWCYILPDDPPIEVRHLTGGWWLIGGIETYRQGEPRPMTVDDVRSMMRIVGHPVTPVDYPPFTIEELERIECRHLGGRWWQVNGHDIGVADRLLTLELAREIWAGLKRGASYGLRRKAVTS